MIFSFKTLKNFKSPSGEKPLNLVPTYSLTDFLYFFFDQSKPYGQLYSINQW